MVGSSHGGDGAGRAGRPAERAAGVAVAHHDLVAQPHTEHEGPIAEAEAVAAMISTAERPLGQPGAPLDRHSPFVIGMTAAAGVAVTVGVVALLVTARQVLVLMGLAFFIAVGLEPAVSWLARRGLARGAAVTAVCLGVLAVIGGFLAAAITPLVTQVSGFVQQAPRYLQALQNHSSVLGQFTGRLQLQQRLEQAISEAGSTIVGGLFGAGRLVLGALASTLVVLVLTVYFLAALPQLRTTLYRLLPHSRRPRAILIGDAIFAKVGHYVLGNVLISLIAGAATFGWLLIFRVPYSLALAALVAVLGLVPVVGTTIAGVVVSLVALTVSLPVALATAGFYVVYQQAENYLLVPKIIGKAVAVPAVLTVVAVLLGGVLLGVVGAIVAIPLAAAAVILTREVIFPRLDQI